VGGRSDGDGDVPPLAARATDGRREARTPPPIGSHAMLEAQSEGSRGVGGLAVGQSLDAPLGQQAQGEQVGHINHPHLTPRTRGRPPDHPGFMMI